MKQITFLLVGLALSLLTGSGCNRASLRVPGASTSFPDTTTHYAAKTKLPYRLVIEVPSDSREKHYGDYVAGTKWQACSTDALWRNNAPQLIQQRLVREFSSSGLFTEVTTNHAVTGDFVLKSDIHAFCSQVTGFFSGHVAGISSMHITAEKDGKVLFDKTFEKVVTDSDPQYTGAQAGFIEQAMRVTMADSLRELMSEALQQCEASARTSSSNNR